jgi:hypothetical protein
MDESEVFIFIVFIFLALVGMGTNTTAPLHPLYFRRNPAPGVVRLGIIAAMAWIYYVLLNHADPSVTGVYVLFYLVMGYAVVKLCGQAMSNRFGTRTRVDAVERRNVPAALVIAAFVLATGLIFGGSLWGEADPDPLSEDEGGWWIPLTFFLLGWGVLVAAFSLFLRREPGRLTERVIRSRSLPDARAAGAFLLSAAVPLTDAVAGDFRGWRHGLLSFGLIAALLLAHEGFASLTSRRAVTSESRAFDGRRVLESGVYLLLGGLAWFFSRAIDAGAGVV